MSDFVYGFVAGGIATVVCHPLDVVKTNIQTSISARPVDVIKRVCTEKLFFRGILPNLSTFPIFWGVFFETKRVLTAITTTTTTHDRDQKTFLIPYVSANVASLVCNPLFVMKVQMQTSSKKMVIKDFRSSIRFVRFWLSGYPVTMVNNMKLGVQFSLYDYLRTSNDSTTSSFVSKVVTTSVTYPLDLVRAIQRKTLNGTPFTTSLRHIYRESGIRGLYRGVVAYNCVSVPHFMIMMYSVEWMTTLLDPTTDTHV